MPEISIILIALFFVSLAGGIAIGWTLRAKRNQKELLAINAGWREQMDAQTQEVDRLVSQNADLMEQNNQYKAAQKDAQNRASELASTLQHAYKSRDEVRPKLKNAIGNLKTSEADRKRLMSELHAAKLKYVPVADLLKKKDKKIGRLEEQLSGWQNRIPPLLASFKKKSRQVKHLEKELLKIQDVLGVLEDDDPDEQSGVAPIESDSLIAGLHASNESSVDDSVSERSPMSSQDDLEKIRGIGPTIKNKLNDVGIFYFHQIASLSEDDIDRVASHLKGFRNLMRRYDWIKQARAFRDMD